MKPLIESQYIKGFNAGYRLQNTGKSLSINKKELFRGIMKRKDLSSYTSGLHDGYQESYLRQKKMLAQKALENLKEQGIDDGLEL